MVALEVHHAIPMHVDGFRLLDRHGNEFLNLLEAELLVRLEEEFGEGVAAAADAAVDRTVAQDLSMGVDDVHTVRSIGVHTLLRGSKPPRNLQRLPRCNSRMPIAEGAKSHPAADSGDGLHIVEKTPYQVDNGIGFGWECALEIDQRRARNYCCDSCFRDKLERHNLHAYFDPLH